MKCPKCEYMSGWDSETTSNVSGDNGSFFTSPVKMEREETFFDEETSTVFGCPKCGIIFIDIS